MLVIGVALLGYVLASVLLLLFGAILVAVILRAIANPITRYTGLPVRVGVVLTLLLLIALLSAAAWLFGRQLGLEFSELARGLPEVWRQLEAWLSDSWWGQQVLTSIREAEPAARDIASRLSGIIWSVGGAISNFLIVLFAGLYLALAPGTYRQGLRKLFPKKREGQVASALENSGHALRLWLLAQLVSMTIVGVLTGLGLWLVGVPYPIALGVIAGLLEFVPIVGPFLSAIPGLLIASTQGMDTVLWALAVYVGVQQLESDLIMPFVIRHAVSIPPAVTLLGVLAMGVLFGPLGIFLAAPLLVVGFVLINQLYVRDALGRDVQILGEEEQK